MLSAVDVNEHLNVRLAADNKRENPAGRLPQSPACRAMLACCTRLVRTLLAGSAFSTGGVTHGARTLGFPALGYGSAPAPCGYRTTGPARPDAGRFWSLVRDTEARCREVHEQF